MTNLHILLKNSFNIFVGALQGKKKRKKTSVAILLILLGTVAIYALTFYQAKTMFDGLSSLGLSRLCVFHACLTTLCVLAIIGVMRVSGNSKFNDAELLLSLPIKKRDIIIVKTINKYLFDLFFVFMLFSPYIILFEVQTGFSISVTIFSVLLTLILPLFSVGLSYIVDFVVSHLFNKSKVAGMLKSLFSVLIYLAIMAVLLIKTFTYGSAEFQSLEAYFADRPLSYMLLKFVLDQSLPDIFGTLALTILPFVLGMILFGFSFGKNLTGYVAKDKDLKFKNKGNLFGSLFKKEVSFYFSTPAYVVNTIIGPVFILAFSIILAIMGADTIGTIFGLEGLSKNEALYIIVPLFCGLVALTMVSCSSISLEGKNLWILKSTPVDTKTLFLAKIMLNIVLVSPVVILSSVILTIALSLSFEEFLIICLLPVILNISLSFGGIIINLWLPKLDWTEETQVVKQSLATLITMILGIILALIPVVLMLAVNVSFELTCLISGAIYLASLICFVILDFGVGIKMFQKL
jgi:ABC-2 type transport system permease protein